jgi:hypothetical protein
MSDRNDIFETVSAQIKPFNKKGVALTDEDEFDIIITMNMQAEIETVGQLVDAVAKLKG